MSDRIASIRRTIFLSAVAGLILACTPIILSESAVSAASVSSGSCASTVDNATGVTMAVATNGDCVLSFAMAPTTPTTSTESVLRSWTVPAQVTSVDVLVVAGGGGGGSSNGCCFDAGAGGGGGVVVATNFAVTAGQSISIKTGLGGRGTYCGNGLNGGNSEFGTLVAVGGGRGGGCSVSVGSGGSGGGAHCSSSSGSSTQTPTQSPITSYGKAGGLSTGCSNGGGGGGGGATEAGAAGTGDGSSGPTGGVGGKGGEGLLNTFRTGTGIVYGSGGGGQGRWMNSAGGTNAGSGSGTDASGGIGIDGVDETGGGGGAGWRGGVAGQAAGDGGSGIVIVRYVPAVSPVNSVVPTISGTKRTGETLTATTGTWTGSPSSYSYQWKRASTVGGTYSDIGSASNVNTYVLADDDIDKFIKVAVVATNGFGASSAALSVATSAIDDLPASVVPTTSAAVSNADGFTFAILNYSNVYTYTVTTTSGSVTRSVDEVTVSGLGSGASATVTVRAARTGYRSASKTISGSATVATTTTVSPTTTVKAVVTIDIQAPVTTVAQGQASVATVAPTTTGPAFAASQVVATTSVPASTTTVKAAPTTTTTVAPLQQSTASIAPPVIPKVSTGESALNVGGVSTKIDLTRENNQLVMKSGEMQATLSGLDDQGETRALDADGNLRLAAGDVVKINVGGFEPGSDVDVWLFSTPRRLGTAVVGADGTVSGSFTIPKDIEDGAHRIAITTKLTNGKEATFTLGVAVGEIAKTSTLTRILIAIPITLAIGFGLVLPTQYRRRRKNLTA